MKRILITGISGSGGSYLAEYILTHQPGVEVHGISRWHSTSSMSNLSNISQNIIMHECDLQDLANVYQVLKAVKPDGIFHLASNANVRVSFTSPISIINNNVQGTLNLLESIRMMEIDPVIQLCSTSEVYGQVEREQVPIKETCALNPTSPYAVSKVAQDLLGYTYYRSYGLKIVRTRMFAYFNPRRLDLFATSFARQIALIEAGKQRELLHGNLDSVRTMIDVRDAMESYWLALTKCLPGEAYNIGGLKSISVREFLEILKGEAKVPIIHRVDPALLRPADVTLQIPDTSKFEARTQWKPKYHFEDSVKHLLQYWRDRVAVDT